MLGLILMLVIVGVVLWLVTTKIPMDPTIKTIIQVVVVICVLIYLLGVFGIADFPVPRVR